jgi:hypothetical protein
MADKVKVDENKKNKVEITLVITAQSHHFKHGEYGIDYGGSLFCSHGYGN